MADNTKIEWADATLNYVNGCSVHSPGCTNCYAMRLAGTRLKHHPSRAGLTTDTKAGPVWTGVVRENPAALEQALRWKKPRAIFWNAHGDLFHENVPWEWIARNIAACILTPQHRHMILTKRSDRMRAWFDTLSTEGGSDDFCEVIELMAESLGREVDGADWTLPIPNLWLGVSVEDQRRADERIPDLLGTPAAIRFISAEPLLGPVDMLSYFDPTGACCGGEPEYRCENCPSDAPWRYSESSSDGQWAFDPRLDWVIVGGESGPGARPMHPDWARSLRDQCEAAGVAFHFKQWGEWMPTEYLEGEGESFGNRFLDGSGRWAENFNGPWLTAGPSAGFESYYRVGKTRAGRLLDGVEHDGVPG